MVQWFPAVGNSIHSLAEFHANNIINIIIKRIECLDNAFRRKKFFRELCNRNYDLLYKILSGNPDFLNDVIDWYDSFSPNAKINNSILHSIFNYTAFSRKNNNGYDIYDLASKLEVCVCLYCNRNYTITVTKGKSKVARAEFDHFYSKKRYPYLALSFYNLIPSCHLCNSVLKGSRVFTRDTHLHPYEKVVDDYFKFTIKFVSSDTFRFSPMEKFGYAFFCGNLDSFKVDLVPRDINIPFHLIRKANNNILDFKLIDIYNSHKEIVNEIVLNVLLYPTSKIDELYSNYNGTLFNSRDDVVRHITKNIHLPTEMSKRSFSKFTRDIHVDLGFLY